MKNFIFFIVFLISFNVSSEDYCKQVYDQNEEERVETLEKISLRQKVLRNSIKLHESNIDEHIKPHYKNYAALAEVEAIPSSAFLGAAAVGGISGPSGFAPGAVIGTVSSLVLEKKRISYDLSSEISHYEREREKVESFASRLLEKNLVQLNKAEAKHDGKLISVSALFGSFFDPNGKYALSRDRFDIYAAKEVALKKID